MQLRQAWPFGRLPPSPQEYPILGLNLLRLLVQNRIAEFHTELELLSATIVYGGGLQLCLECETDCTP
ncbi:hypothetical protein CsSME_00050721 [Camellia sinensis var. sinensis]